MNENIKALPAQIEKLEQIIEEIDKLAKEQFAEDLDKLKVYMKGAGTIRLDSLGAIGELCNIIRKDIERMKICLEQANEAAARIEVK